MRKLDFSFFIPLILFFSISSVESKTTSIKIECKGKTYVNKNSDNWSSEQNLNYDIVNVYGLSNSKDRDNWYFDTGNFIYSNTEGNDPRQPSNPYWYRFISVTNDEISIIISGGNDFDKRKKDDRHNQKYEYRHEIKINRISGEWTEVSSRKTSWKDGGWLTNDFNIVGKCQKGIQKF